MSGERWVQSDDDTLEWGADFCLDPTVLGAWADQRDEAVTAMAALIEALSDAALLAQIRQAVDAWFADDDANDRAAIHAIAALLGEQ